MAENDETGIVRLVAVAGMVKAVTAGAVVSAGVMATFAESGAEIFPAASLAKA